MRLHPAFAPPVQADETPTSYCSRVAFGMGLNARDLARNIGTSFQGIIDGVEDSLAILIGACSLDTKAFERTALVRTADRTYTIAGQVFARKNLTRMRMYVCPTCIAQHGAYGRARWQIESLRVCLQHGCMLVPVGRDTSPHRSHDFARHLHAEIDSVRETPSVPMPDGTEGLARYLVGLLDGSDAGGWLAAMPAYAAARSCEVVGLAVTKGVHGLWQTLDNAERHVAGSVGYSLLSDGPGSLTGYLQDLRRAAPIEEFGLRKVYGRLFDFFSHDNHDQAFEPVRKVVRDHLLDTVAVAAGDVVLGQTVDARRLHSVRSLGIETGLDARLVRRRLDALGVIPESDANLPNDRLLVDARAHAAVLEKLGGLLVRPDAERYLGVTHHQGYALDESLIAPFRSQGLKPVDHLFLRSDLDAYLDRLIAGATPLAPSEKGFHPIGKTAQRCKSQPLAIMRLLAEQRIANVRLDPDRAGIPAIMIDVAEVKALLSPPNNLLSARALKYDLQCSLEVANALIGSGTLPSTMTRHPVNATRCRMVPRPDVEAFKRKYTSLHVLALEVGRHPRGLKKLLAGMKIEPALNPEKTRTLFFSRERIAPIIDQLRP